MTSYGIIVTPRNVKKKKKKEKTQIKARSKRNKIIYIYERNKKIIYNV